MRTLDLFALTKRLVFSGVFTVFFAAGGAGLHAQQGKENEGKPGVTNGGSVSVSGSAAGAASKPKSGPVADAIFSRFYEVTETKGPAGVDAQVGGLIALSGGRMAAVFHRGELAVWEPSKGEWSIFAEGLHEPLGLLEEADGSFLVMQRPELTRLRDKDGDGKADEYETVWDGFGMTGNYHEFAFGPVRGENGKVYVAFNLASNGDTVRKEVRGQWLDVGVPREKFYGSEWKTVSKQAGRMYSRVPWRGWVMEVDVSARKAVPFASGFRSPDGLGFDGNGNLLVSDNQGDWRGTSELHVVKKGGFYGHPASLPWTPGWGSQPPLEIPVEQLNEWRAPAAVWFPQGSIANSPTQMIRIPSSPAWGPFGGQMLIGEMNAPKLLRVTLEEVDGRWQGACYPFLHSEKIKRGLHRLAFQGDTLWVGRTHLSWAGGEHLAQIRPTGNLPFDPVEVKAVAGGFEVRFSHPVDSAAADAQVWKIRRYTFNYGSAYGSPELQSENLLVESVALAADGLSARLALPGLVEDFVYDFDMSGVRSSSGDAPLNGRAVYTLRRLVH
jgi:glucose/arabinose dehydrogenase